MTSLRPDIRWCPPLVIGVVLGQGHGSFPGHGELVLHAGDVDVVAVVGVPGGKMPLEDRHLKLGLNLDVSWIAFIFLPPVL